MSRLNWVLHPRETSSRAWKHLQVWGREALSFVRANRVPLAVLVILVVVTVGGVWSLVHFWDWLQTEQINGNVVAKESGSTTVRNIGFVVAGLVALPFAIWRSWVAHRHADTAQKTLLNERYQQGAEMLGSNISTVRLGGIYALQRLAAEHPDEYHLQVMRLFCAFARRPTTDEGPRQSPVSADESELPELRQDVQAVMTAISACHAIQHDLEREQYDGQASLNLKGANLPCAELWSTDFSSAHLPGVNLAGANLWNANLYHAVLWEANLSHANLQRAYLYEARLQGADLSGAEFSLDGENPATGLTQFRLDQARADPDDPPQLEGVVDAETGKPLIWCGRPLSDTA